MAVSILRSVGSGGNNNAHDVTTIQTLLNKWLDPKIAVSGTCDGTETNLTVKAIRTFQSYFTKTPDGRVDPGGGTLRRLGADPLVLLPQMSGFGYYSYGSGGWYDRQWGTPDTIRTLQNVARIFRQKYPTIPIGIGDISFRFGGKMAPHGSHKEGKHVDLRPVRKDGLKVPVTYQDANYDQTATQYLIDAFLCQVNVKGVLFNDPAIHKASPYVNPWQGHDNHMHVTMLK